jgi:uncharacterized protein YndB with AHSA1/START domain
VARAEIAIAAPPERVFEVLSDGRLYGHWVVGSRAVRDVDPGWPAPGTRLHHTVGIGPLSLSDNTCVEECEPPWLLRLRARARPLATAVVSIELQPHAVWTRVVMVEDAGDPLSCIWFAPPVQPLLRRRNAASLRRLRDLAEGRGPSPEEARRP